MRRSLDFDRFLDLDLLLNFEPFRCLDPLLDLVLGLFVDLLLDLLLDWLLDLFLDRLLDLFLGLLLALFLDLLLDFFLDLLLDFFFNLLLDLFRDLLRLCCLDFDLLLDQFLLDLLVLLDFLSFFSFFSFFFFFNLDLEVDRERDFDLELDEDDLLFDLKNTSKYMTIDLFTDCNVYVVIKWKKSHKQWQPTFSSWTFSLLPNQFLQDWLETV